MPSIRTVVLLVAVMAGAVALGAANPDRVAAQSISSSAVCSAGAFGLDTCLLTLGQSVSAGGSFTAALLDPAGAMVNCQSLATGSSCTVSGNTLTVVCPNSCPAGSQVQEVLQAFDGQDLAQQLTIAEPVTSSPVVVMVPPPTFAACLSGVSTSVGCIPTASYLTYLQCVTGWSPVCSFDLGYGYVGYYFPTAVTYAFYNPLGDYYGLYSPMSSTYYAFYTPVNQYYSYWNPAGGYYAFSPLTAPAVFDAAAPSMAGLLPAIEAPSPYVSPNVVTLFVPPSSVSTVDAAPFDAHTGVRTVAFPAPNPADVAAFRPVPTTSAISFFRGNLGPAGLAAPADVAAPVRPPAFADHPSAANDDSAPPQRLSSGSVAGAAQAMSSDLQPASHGSRPSDESIAVAPPQPALPSRAANVAPAVSPPQPTVHSTDAASVQPGPGYVTVPQPDERPRAVADPSPATSPQPAVVGPPVEAGVAGRSPQPNAGYVTPAQTSGYAGPDVAPPPARMPAPAVAGIPAPIGANSAIVQPNGGQPNAGGRGAMPTGAGDPAGGRPPHR